jgi:predicted DNA-binding ribbon-helix-helix protein
MLEPSSTSDSLQNGPQFSCQYRTIPILRMTTPYHPPIKRSVEIAGHKTSISLEPLFWELLKTAAQNEQLPINALIARIDAERIVAEVPPGLGSAIRLWLVAWLAARL